MKLQYAASFTGITVTIAAIYMALFMRTGLNSAGDTLTRQAWMQFNLPIWTLGWWLWMLALFSWMVLLVTLMWSYSPAHRVPTILQSGLIIIAAVLNIVGIVAWMAVLPAVLREGMMNPSGLAALIDHLALGLIGAGCFMGGIVTAWMGIDLWRLKKLRGRWVALGVVAGLCAIPSPLLLPQPYPLIAALIFWLLWSIFLATRRSAPSAFAEWQGL